LEFVSIPYVLSLLGTSFLLEGHASLLCPGQLEKLLEHLLHRADRLLPASCLRGNDPLKPLMKSRPPHLKGFRELAVRKPTIAQIAIDRI
jgi:hypothetical protein